MSEQLFSVTITAVGEVRDKDGNLLNSQPVEQTVEMTADQLKAAFGVDAPEGT